MNGAPQPDPSRWFTGPWRGVAGGIPLLLFLPEYLGPTPSRWRLAWVLAVSVTLGGWLAWQGRRGTPPRPPSPRRAWLAGPWPLVLAGFVVATALALGLYRAFGDYLAYDLAYYHQVLWNTARGRFLEGSILQALYYDPPLANDLGLHLSPVLLLLLPFHALLPSSATLLVLGQLALSLGAWPAYRLAEELCGRDAARPLAGAFLLTPAVAAAPLHAFYPSVLAVTPLLWALLAYHRQQPGRCLLWLGLALLVREDIGLLLAGVGLMAGLHRLLGERRPWGWAWCVVPLLLGLGWFAAATLWWMPAGGGRASGQAVLSWYAGHGSSLGEILGRLLTDPAYALQALFGGERPLYLYRLVRSLGLLPLLGVGSVAALPGMAVNLLATGPATPTLDHTAHYSILLMPLLFFGGLQGLRWLLRGREPQLCRVAALIVLGVGLAGLPEAWPRELLGRLRPPSQAEALRQAAALVPPGRSVLANSHVLPRVASTPAALPLERIFRSRPGRPDYVLHDRDRSRYYIRPAEEELVARRVESFFTDPAYELIFDRDGVRVLRRRGDP